MRNITLLTLLFISFSLMGQDSSLNYKIQSFSFGIGSNGYRSDFNSFGEVKDLAKTNKEIFDIDLSTFEEYESIPTNNAVYFLLGFKNVKYENNRELLIGLNYRSGTRNYLNYSYNYSFPGDTFNIADTKVYTDTSVWQHYTLQNDFSDFGINMVQLYKTDPEKRIQLYTGFGSELNVSILSSISVSNYKDSTFEMTFEGKHVYSNNLGNQLSYSGNTKKTKAKTSIIFSPYIPIGISLRLSKKYAELKQMNLFFQSKFGLEYQIYFDHKDYLSPYMGFMMGIRYQLS